MNKKKLLALLMALVMTLTLVPVTAFADGPEFEAMIGETGYTTVAEALRNITDDNYASFSLLVDNAWPDSTPVFVITNQNTDGEFVTKLDNGTKVNNYNTFSGYGDNVTSIKLFCKPSSNVACNSDHPSFTCDTTIYGFGATIGKGAEMSVESYVPLNSDVTLKIFNLTNGAFWGGRTTNYTVNLYLIGCGDAHEICFRSPTTGTGLVNTYVSNCTFNGNSNSASSSIQVKFGGTTTISNCTFSNVAVPVNFNNDAATGQTITVSNCTFNDCGISSNKSFDASYCAPIRVVAPNATPTSALTVTDCTFTYTNDAAANGDVVIGEQRANKEGAGVVTLYMTGTAATVKAHTIHAPNVDNINTEVTSVAANESLNTDNDIHVVNYVAQIGTTNYETLAEAIAVANADTTATAENPVVVKLLQNTSISDTIEITNQVTLDGNGKTITADNTVTRGIWIDKGNVTVSVKNLTIAGSKLERAIQVNPNMDNVTLTIDHVTATATMYTVNICSDVANLTMNITNSDLTGWGVINLWGNNGTVTISGSTLTGINDKGYNADGWNDFGTVVVEGDTTGQTDTHASAYNISISDTTISASQTTGNQQFALLYNNPSVNNAITLTGCSISLGSNCSFLCNQSNDGVDYSTTKIKNTFVSGTSDTLPVLPAGYTYVDVADDYKQVALHYVAQVGNTQYTTLEAAIAAAPSGGTVKLIDDIDYSTIYTERNARDYGREHAIDLGNLTLDMNGHSISTINATVVFGGDGATITNGTFALVPKNTDGSYKAGSYALIIDNAVNEHGASGTVLVKNVICNGGINLCSADVTLDNVTASTTPTKFYAVWAEQNAKVTILGGTYTLNTDGNGVLATGTGDEGGAKIYVTGGNYNDGNKLVYKNSASDSIQITGGKFYNDPSQYVADGYEAVSIDEDSYFYQVGKVKATDLAKQESTDTSATYTATKSVVDTQTGSEIAGSNSTSYSITVAAPVQSAVGTTEASKETVKLSNIKVDEVVAAAVDKADESNETSASVEVQLAKSAATVEEDDNQQVTAITYEVHPEAIITVSKTNEENVVTTVALSNDQITGSFSFKLYVGNYFSGQVNVTHIHENGDKDDLGIVTVDNNGFITLTAIQSFSDFQIVPITLDTEDTGEYFTMVGGSLRRRIKTSDRVTVVNTSTDIRFTYKILQYNENAEYYFQWSLNNNTWSKAVPVTQFDTENNETLASLVITNVPSSYFDRNFYTRIYVVDDSGTHMLQGEAKSVDYIADKLAVNSDNDYHAKWVNYGKYLCGNYGISSYEVIRNTNDAIVGHRINGSEEISDS